MIFSVETEIENFPQYHRTIEEINMYLRVCEQEKMDVERVKEFFRDEPDGVYVHGKVNVMVKFDSKDYLIKQ